MKLSFRVARGDELGDEEFLDYDYEPESNAGHMIMAVRFKLTLRFNGHGCGPRRIQVFLNEVRIQSQRTLGEQGVVDGSLLTVRWLWSGEQRKKTNCLTHKERKEEMEKRVRELAR